MQLRKSISFYVLVLLVFSAIAVPLAIGQAGDRDRANSPAMMLPDFTGIVERASPAVVNITVTSFGERPQIREETQGEQVPDQEVPEIFRRFFDIPGMPRGQQGQPDRVGGGSGFIIDTDGYIVTNHHVVDDADQVLVRLSDRREYVAEVIGSDPQSDIALIKIDAENLTSLKWASSNDLKIGEWVLAIGSPFTLEQTVTQGIVSAVGRSNPQQQYVPFIQTDVAINRGNSGGPLLNLKGEVIGVNSWIFSNSGSYIGLSFSIPSETASNAINQLQETGTVSRGLLGVNIQGLNRELAEAQGLTRTAGALVSNVQPDSAAAKAGIQVGDVIVEYAGTPIELWTDLPPLVGATPPGDEADVVIIRDGKRQTLTATVIALPPDDQAVASSDEQAEEFTNRLGIVVEGIGNELRRELGNPEGGVIVSRVESDAAFRSGLRRGDVILRVNNIPVEGMQQFEELLEDVDSQRAVALLVERDGVKTFLAVRPDSGEE